MLRAKRRSLISFPKVGRASPRRTPDFVFFDDDTTPFQALIFGAAGGLIIPSLSLEPYREPERKPTVALRG